MWYLRSGFCCHDLGCLPAAGVPGRRKVLIPGRGVAWSVVGVAFDHRAIVACRLPIR